MFIEVPVVLAWTESSVFLFDKEEGSGFGELEGHIFPAQRFSSRKVSVARRSSGERG